MLYPKWVQYCAKTRFPGEEREGSKTKKTSSPEASKMMNRGFQRHLDGNEKKEGSLGRSEGRKKIRRWKKSKEVRPTTNTEAQEILNLANTIKKLSNENWSPETKIRSYGFELMNLVIV